jgi:hypothetical protein
MTIDERNAAWLRLVLLALAPIAIAALVASFVWGVDAMSGGAPWKLVGLAPRVCPGCAACGLSRAFSAASHGELVRALAFNPAVALLYPAFWAVAIGGPVLAARRWASRR